MIPRRIPRRTSPKRAKMNEEKQPLLAHFEELRKALLICLITLAAAFFLIYALLIGPLMNLITEPIASRGIQVIYTGVSEALVTKLKVALTAACVADAPVILYVLWRFIRPGLYDRERKMVKRTLLIMLFLFAAGVAFCLLAVYSLAMDFFLVAGEDFSTPMLSLDKYVGFLTGFTVPFGIAFELPVVLYLTTRMGLTDYRMLAAKRKYVVLGVFVIAAFLTPPDVVSQIALGVPMVGLYEIGVQVCRKVKPRGGDEEPLSQQS